MNRRHGLIALAAAATGVRAQTAARYPERPIRIIVPYSAGGGGDTIARLIASQLSQPLGGATLVVENRVGAGGNIGTEAMIKSPPDGYTLAVVSGTYTTQAVTSRLAFDPIASITPLTQLVQETAVLVVNAKSPDRTLRELIARAKAEPGRLSYGSSGAGGLPHLVTELFAMRAGIKLNHIPYKGTSAALNDLLGGQIDLVLIGTAAAAPHVRAGALRALAASGAVRSRLLPDVPTFPEAGLSSEIPLHWHALLAPKGLPPDIAARLVAAVDSSLANPEVRRRLAGDAIEPASAGPAALMALIQRDLALWRSVVQAIGFKVE